MSQPSSANPSASVATFERERRREHRRPTITKAVVTILDGPTAGATHEVLTRDLSDSGLSFLLRDGLSVGQMCKITIQNGQARSWLAEVVRTRPLSTGKSEMAVVFRKPA